MKRILPVMIASVLALVAMIFVLSQGLNKKPSQVSDGESGAQSSIMVHCAASNRAVMEAIRVDYQEEFDREVHVNYGSSQGLLSQIEVSKSGDLYLPADDSYLKLAAEKELVDEVLPIARQQAVIAIAKGNPKNIQSLKDLYRDDVRLVQANPDAAAVGKIARKLLRQFGAWDDVEQTTTAFRGTVTEVANDIKVGAADAGFVYDAVLHTYPDLEFIEIPELEKGSSQIAISVVRGSKQPQAALHFARYVSARDRGLKRYGEFGFRVNNGGDEWKDQPELNIFAGSMLRPAIEHTITAFEQREGVLVNRVYNGCGVLVAQMQAGQRPDAYFACDTEFMDRVADLFPEPITVSQNQLVILVKKGNPENIETLKDLTRPKLRVGIGHEKQCAMGWLTQNTLREGGVQTEVMENVTMQSATGDMLVNAMLTGSLDAAVVYLSNAAGSSEELDAIAITDLPCSIASQPWAVAKESAYPNLAGRLFDKITSTQSQEDFAAEGFLWQLEATP